MDRTATDSIARSVERADETTAKARAAIKAIPAYQFGEREAAALLEALQERVAASTWKHTKQADELGDALTDAHLIAENAADAISLESA